MNSPDRCQGPARAARMRRLRRWRARPSMGTPFMTSLFHRGLHIRSRRTSPMLPGTIFVNAVFSGKVSAREPSGRISSSPGDFTWCRAQSIVTLPVLPTAPVSSTFGQKKAEPNATCSPATRTVSASMIATTSSRATTMRHSSARATAPDAIRTSATAAVRWDLMDIALPMPQLDAGQSDAGFTDAAAPPATRNRWRARRESNPRPRR